MVKPYLPEAVHERQTHKGRGAASNPAGRFEVLTGFGVDDGWRRPEDDEPSAPATVVLRDTSRSLINRIRSPDVPFDRSINVYRGCEHGCVYCFARPSHGYLGMSAGLDFETKILVKPDGAVLLRQELGKKAYKPAPVTLGSNTDPYQPLERRLGLTRAALKVLAETRHPVAIVTKNHNVIRDIDLLAAMAKNGLVHVAVSVTSLERERARTLEPRASTPQRRLDAIRALAAADIPTIAMVAPIIPGLTDHEIEPIVEAVHDAGAWTAAMLLIRLPWEVKDLFAQWLEAHVPDRRNRVLSLIRQCRDGALNQTAWGKRMRGQGPYADLLFQRFDKAKARVGLTRTLPRLRTDPFRADRIHDTAQGDLFAP